MSKHRNETRLLDIIIPVHGRFDILGKCLEALPGALGDIHPYVILVDNASPDPDEARYFYEHIDPSYIVVRNKENVGFPVSCNMGVRRKSSPLILLLNSDVLLYPQAVAHMAHILDDPKVGVVGAKLLFPTEDQLRNMRLDPRIRPAGKVQHVGIETNIRGEFYHIFLGWSPDHPKVERMYETYAVTGACLMTRRSLWNKIGGFLEAYGQGTYEDVDYCLSARDAGLAVVVDTQAVGVHYTGATSEAYNKPMPLQINRMIFMQRWGNRLNYTEHERL